MKTNSQLLVPNEKQMCGYFTHMHSLNSGIYISVTVKF